MKVSQSACNPFGVQTDFHLMRLWDYTRIYIDIVNDTEWNVYWKNPPGLTSFSCKVNVRLILTQSRPVHKAQRKYEWFIVFMVVYFFSITVLYLSWAWSMVQHAVALTTVLWNDHQIPCRAAFTCSSYPQSVLWHAFLLQWWSVASGCAQFEQLQQQRRVRWCMDPRAHHIS